MLILAGEADGFRDSRDAAVRYRLPSALEAEPVAGAPGVLLATHAAGGVLALRLAFAWPDLGNDERRVPIESGRFRMSFRTPGGDDAGQWHDCALTGETAVSRSVTLAALESSLARRLAAAGNHVLDVEAEFTVNGRSATYPWRIRANTEQLKAVLSGSFGDAPTDWRAIEQAFVGMRREDFEWYPREANALPAPADAAMSLFARHARPLMFSPSGDDWLLNDDLPEWLDLDLSLPRSLRHTFGLNWSFTDFLAAQPDPSKHFVELDTPAPFEAAELLLTHDLVLGEKSIRKVDVEVLTDSPGGESNHRFTPDSPSAVRLRFVRATFTELDLRARINATVMSSRGPVIVRKELRSDDLGLHITESTLGIVAVPVSAEPEVFDHVEALELRLGSRKIVLRAGDDTFWAIRSSPAESAAVDALLETGERISLGDVVPSDGRIVVSADFLGIGSTAEISFDCAAARQQSAYVAIRTQDGPWRTIDSDVLLYGQARLVSRLSPVHVSYQVRHVPRQPDGTTATMVESDWRSATGTSVTVAV